MNRLISAACLAALALAAGPAAAQDPNFTRNLAATCAPCHGTNGKAIPGAGQVPLAGEAQETIASRLHEFRAGTRPATIMHQIAKGYTDEQIKQLAAWFAAQKK
ncbi:MAG: c-type cytochrome [Rhodocyclaceae bacterium]|nr:c-type cytochrome [Rhodocyclaceae bacterium]